MALTSLIEKEAKHCSVGDELKYVAGRGGNVTVSVCNALVKIVQVKKKLSH
jgi:hypothetical protein